MKYFLATGAVIAFTALPATAQSLDFADDYSLSTITSDASPEYSAQTLDKIVAVVGDGLVLESELDRATAQIKARARGRANQIPPNILRSKVLDRLIIQQLQVQRANERGIQISDQEIDAGVRRIAQQNNMDMPQFLSAIAADGTSMESLRAQVREDIQISKLRRQEVMSKVSISDEDVDRYLENQSLRDNEDREYRLRHILLPVPAGADADTVDQMQARAAALHERIVDEDADFADLAAAQSRGKNAADGGAMGWTTAAALPAGFAQAARTLSPGQTSDVFRDANGFHLLQLEDVRGGDALEPERKVMVNEVQTRHLLLKPNEVRDDERTRKLARQILARLEAGDDFAELAREYSDDTATANQGGDLGWVQPRQLDPATRRQISGMQAGDISPIFQTGEGYEILKVSERRERDQTVEARRQRARRSLGEQKSVEEGELWLRKLRDEAYVDVRMAGYQPTSGG